MTVEAAARYMVELLERSGELRQDEAVSKLRAKFRDEYVYLNGNGNLAIQPAVLKRFKKLTPDYVWFRPSRYWRRRQWGDQPRRLQAY
ncbi:MAG: hypothetical protein V7704_06235 [Aurantimonas endophytica]|uniref:DUF6953 family protein n=1 Tax=Aurantimonas endophytica TaxID=1522175 RepID=UPI00300326F2